MGGLHLRSWSISEGVLPLSINYRENFGQTALKYMWFDYIPKVVWNKSSKWCLHLECCYAQSAISRSYFSPQELVISVLNSWVSMEPGLISKDHLIN